MKIELSESVMIDINVLVPDPNNARKHGAKNKRSIRESLKQFGQVEPLIVREQNGVVIGGNARLEVMKELGYQNVLVRKVSCDNQQASALALALNRSGELAEWDLEQLAVTLGDLSSLDDLGLDDLGFAAGDFKLPSDEDTDPGPSPKPKVERWQMGGHTLTVGESSVNGEVEAIVGAWNKHTGYQAVKLD